MFHGGAKYSTKRVKCFAKVLNIPRIGLNVPRSCKLFHGEGQTGHGGAKYSEERVTWSTEVLNIPRTMSNIPRTLSNVPRRGPNVPRRC